MFPAIGDIERTHHHEHRSHHPDRTARVDRRVLGRTHLYARAQRRRRQRSVVPPTDGRGRRCRADRSRHVAPAARRQFHLGEKVPSRRRLGRHIAAAGVQGALHRSSSRRQRNALRQDCWPSPPSAWWCRATSKGSAERQPPSSAPQTFQASRLADHIGEFDGCADMPNCYISALRIAEFAKRFQWISASFVPSSPLPNSAA